MYELINEKFIENVDFFCVKPADIQKYEIRTFEINVTNRGLILLTESFTDHLI